jgi:hypothetical protein
VKRMKIKLDVIGIVLLLLATKVYSSNSSGHIKTDVHELDKHETDNRKLDTQEEVINEAS